jgi:uncharacterized protein (TIGR02646 family)
LKKIIKLEEPEILEKYREMYPDDDWKSGFYANSGKDGIKCVRDGLLREQGGLCVYCEIDLKLGEGIANNDFRVEHFYPDNPPKNIQRRNDGINYSLHWKNLFGCCHGGDVSSVIEKSQRYTKPDVHCDINKKNNDWTDKLLNPITDIPNTSSIFEFDEDGFISVKETTVSVNIKVKAENTIKLLSLDSKSLNKFRKSIIDQLAQEIQSNSTLELDEILYDLASVYLSKNDDGNYNCPFFSTVRWYLADGAERFLKL